MNAQTENEFLLERLSCVLNRHADAITGEMVKTLASECSVPEDEAYALLLAGLCGLDVAENADDRALYRRVFPLMLQRLEPMAYRDDPYYRAIRVPQLREDAWEFRTERYQPYELFVRDDLRVCPDGRVLPQLGYFTETFEYPAVLENGREWMLVTPNEINTMRHAVQLAQGRVLAYGLGLGYFALMALRKPEVSAVTVVERDPAVFRLFREHLLSQFPNREKLTLIEADAFEFARRRMTEGRFDVVFTDLWHDPSDGIALYRRMKALEFLSPGSCFCYWIEPTLKAYMCSIDS